MFIQRCCGARVSGTGADLACPASSARAPQCSCGTASCRGARLLAEFVQFSQFGDQAINALLQWNCITRV